MDRGENEIEALQRGGEMSNLDEREAITESVTHPSENGGQVS